MDKDYKNFVERMGSFEDELDIGDNEISQSERIIVTRNRGALSEEELKHFGIKGMRWGISKRVNANVISKAAKTGQDVTSLGQHVNRGGFNKKTVETAKKLSDDDLKTLTNRLNLENNYINAKQQQSGRSKVESILTTAGSALAVASSAAILYDAIKKVK